MNLTHVIHYRQLHNYELFASMKEKCQMALTVKVMVKYEHQYAKQNKSTYPGHSLSHDLKILSHVPNSNFVLFMSYFHFNGETFL